jgi:hypothetical protein
MEEKNIECKVVKDLVTQEGGRGTNKLRIVRWIVDGKDTGALLEKRNFYNTKDGEERMGKAKGFNLTDLNYIVQNWKEIQPLM